MAEVGVEVGVKEDSDEPNCGSSRTFYLSTVRDLPDVIP